MLNAGSSKHWRITLREFTGSSNILVDPLLEYFKPLIEWLKKDNKEQNEFIGWQGGKCISIYI